MKRILLRGVVLAMLFCMEASGQTVQMMFGTAKPFAPELLNALYGDLKHYEELAAASTDRAIAQGFLLPEDREWMIKSAVAVAKQRGLK